ncbi:MAG TPA: vitamin B12 dependent-methionine synthase activation domain-containing protein, partial [Candidatus Baltobacteraceae bacterium]
GRLKGEALAQSAAQRNAVAPSNAPIPVSAIKGERADVPHAPFFGARTLHDVDLSQLWPCFDLRSLYRLSWGAANTKGDAFERLVREDFEPRLQRYQRRALDGGLLRPRVVYGYFPAAGVGDDVIVYDPNDTAREIARFPFARQRGGEHLCLADYLREPENGRGVDLVALQVVTVGTDASEQTEALHKAGDYSESYFLHGFSVQSAEALAEWTHRHIRAELRLPEDRGKRYSWGYGACPDLSQHRIAFDLLDAENAIGTVLTEAFQIIPEQSTAAIILHHPRAAYFNAAAVRELEPA